MLPTEQQEVGEDTHPGGGEDIDTDMQLKTTDLREVTAFLIEGVLIPLLTGFGIIGEWKLSFLPFGFDDKCFPIKLPIHSTIAVHEIQTP